MPVYLITLHAYGTWLPDREEGYRHHTRGRLGPNREEADRYRERQAQAAATFTRPVQRILIRSTLEAAARQRLRPYFIATDPTHTHSLLGWTDRRPAENVRERLKQSLSRDLNGMVERRRWFVRNGWVERVNDERHFTHLVEEYLPQHSGWLWDFESGWTRTPLADREPLARG
jgi:hypothetical protein